MSESITHHQTLSMALEAHALGFNVVPLIPGTKKTKVKWGPYQDMRVQEADIHSWDWEDGSVGAVLGVMDLHTIDIDGDDEHDCAETADKIVQAMRAKGCDPMVVHSGSGHGWHITFHSGDQDHIVTNPGASAVDCEPKDPETADFTHMELRWSRCIVVLPPSLHKSGGRYKGEIVRPGYIPYEDLIELYTAHVNPRKGKTPLYPDIRDYQPATNTIRI